MCYKTILVPVDDTPQARTRIAVAGQLAISHGAHLIGAAVTGVSRFLEEAVAINVYDPGLTSFLEKLRGRATSALDRFDEQVGSLGVRSFERRLVDDEGEGGISLHARYCDLVVLSQYDRDRAVRAAGGDYPERIAAASGTPVLIVPAFGGVPSMGQRVLVAWNGSREAGRALRDALPLLQQAAHVTLLSFDTGRLPMAQADLADAEIGHYLARQGVAAELAVQVADDSEIGATLLSRVADSGADLLVMGCYGHSRFREMLLGGATRTVLESMTVAVLMSH